MKLKNKLKIRKVYIILILLIIFILAICIIAYYTKQNKTNISNNRQPNNNHIVANTDIDKKIPQDLEQEEVQDDNSEQNTENQIIDENTQLDYNQTVGNQNVESNTNNKTQTNNNISTQPTIQGNQQNNNNESSNISNSQEKPNEVVQEEQKEPQEIGEKYVRNDEMIEKIRKTIENNASEYMINYGYEIVVDSSIKTSTNQFTFTETRVKNYIVYKFGTIRIYAEDYYRDGQYIMTECYIL